MRREVFDLAKHGVHAESLLRCCQRLPLLSVVLFSCRLPCAPYAGTFFRPTMIAILMKRKRRGPVLQAPALPQLLRQLLLRPQLVPSCQLMAARRQGFLHTRPVVQIPVIRSLPQRLPWPTAIFRLLAMLR